MSEKPVQVELLGLAHQTLRQVHELLPEEHLHLPSEAHVRVGVGLNATSLKVLEVFPQLLVLMTRLDVYVGLVVDLPAPPVVVEGTDVHHLLVHHVGFGVEDFLVQLVDLESLLDELPEQKAVLEELVDGLVSLGAGD